MFFSKVGFYVAPSQQTEKILKSYNTTEHKALVEKSKLKSKTDEQLLLRGKYSNFNFKFSTNEKHLLIQDIEQKIDFGWEAPSDEVKYNGNKAINNVSFQENKTQHVITLNGVCYPNSGIGAGFNEFTKFKNIASKPIKNKGELWEVCYTQDNMVKKLQNTWYVKNISQNSSNFISGINALKIEFTLTLQRFN